MKRVLICLLSIITVSNEGNLKLTRASHPDNRGFTVNHYEAMVQDASQDEKSILHRSKAVGITKKILTKSSQPESLLPSRAVIEDPKYYNTEISSNVPESDESLVLASADAQTTDTVTSPIEEDHSNENGNNSTIYISAYENNEYLIGKESKIQVSSSNANSSEKAVNESQVIGTSTGETVEEERERKKSSPQHEDIPSFIEWTQQQLAEAEKKKMDYNETAERFAKGRGKFRIKNYASPDCGAKIVASNPESVSSSSVLSSLKDEYMLNYCTNRIWFIVELCEAIQAKQLDLANFELFSSSPKHFSVFVSHRFPTREWSNVGKFTAEDSRDVQTFNLNPHLFGKFIKVEMHSHYGREQFCPISWVGVYGTSEYEVLAKEDERNLAAEDDYGDSYDEEIFLGNKRNSPKNLFSSATEAVLSIVKKATAPFMKSESNETESKNCSYSANSINSRCVSPRYIIVCNNCTQDFYDQVFHYLSCQFHKLEPLTQSPFVSHVLIHSETCIELGLDFTNAKKGAPFPSNFLRTSDQSVKYLAVMLNNSFLAALCNALAVSENKVVINATAEGIQSLKNLTQKVDYCEGTLDYPEPEPALTASPCQDECSDVSSSDLPASAAVGKPPESTGRPDSLDIQPTKTVESNQRDTASPAGLPELRTAVPDPGSLDPALSDHSPSTAALPEDEEKKGISDTHSHGGGAKEAKISVTEGKDTAPKDADPETKSGNAVTQDSTTLESIIGDLNAIERVVNTPASAFAASNLPTESIFLRLANRIKNLEINMSLSSTYLEEMSKRYRMQLELLSKSLNLTIQKVEEYSKAEEEKERKREKEMLLMRMQLANLTRDVALFVTERNSWRPQASSLSQHVLFIAVESLLIWIIYNYWKKSEEQPAEKSDGGKKPGKKLKRRNSLEGVRGHEVPRRKTRRPSEEALDIALSRTYGGESLKAEKKRRRRKKDSKCSLNGFQPRRKISEVEVLDGNFDNRMVPAFVSEECGSSGIGEIDQIGASTRSPSILEGGGSTVEGIVTPSFMKTALAARNCRMWDKQSSQECGADDEATRRATQKERKGSNSLKKYMKKFF